MKYFIIVIFLQSLLPFTCTEEQIIAIINHCHDLDADGDGDCCTVNRLPLRCDSSCYIGQCLLGQCVYTPKVCDDNDECTHDICDISTGDCVFRGHPCNPCDTINCDDNDLCTADACVNTHCIHIPAYCGDGDICTIDVCVGGICFHDTIPGCNDPCETVNCSDEDVCTIDTCINGVCTNTAIVCNDGLFCTEDWCSANATDSTRWVCNYRPYTCSDNDFCTTDECVEDVRSYKCINILRSCDDNNLCSRDTCYGNICRHFFIGCDDNYPCTVDTCINGQCVNTPYICNDNNHCTNDNCLGDGTCEHWASNWCDDNNLCTSDSCITGGTCLNEVIDCNDFNACTYDGCNDQFGQCIHVPVNCDDGDTCTVDWCAVKDGNCFHDDTCTIITCDTIPDPAYYDPIHGASFCKVIVCGVNTVRDCGDGIACTNDFCNEIANECIHLPVDCADGTGQPYCCNEQYGNCEYGGNCCSSDDPCYYAYWENDPNDFVHGTCILINICKVIGDAVMYDSYGRRMGSFTQIKDWMPAGFYYVRRIVDGKIISTTLINIK